MPVSTPSNKADLKNRLSIAALISILFHFILLILLGLWTVYQYAVEGDHEMAVTMEESSGPEMDHEPVEEVIVEEMPQEIAVDLERLTVDPLHEVELPRLAAQITSVPTPVTPTIPTSTASSVVFHSAVPRASWGRPFGQREENDLLLRGYYYDFKRLANGETSGLQNRDHFPIIREYIESGFNESVLARYFRVPDPLFASHIFHPRRSSNLALEAYDAGRHGVGPGTWAVHYQGKFSPPETGRYRFITKAEAGMVVIVNRKVVSQNGFGNDHQIARWQPSQRYNYGLPGNAASVGDWINLRRGQAYDIEIFLGDGRVGNYQAMLMVEQDGVTYEKDSRGNPILPIFTLAESEEPLPDFGPNALPVAPMPLLMSTAR